MRDDRFEVSVTFDERRGYVVSAPELRQPIVALSLGGLSRRIEVLLLPDDVDVVLQTAQQKIDALFGADYARSHPEVLVVVVQSAASDWAAQRLGVAIERVAEALLIEEAPEQIVAARGLPWSHP